VRDYRQRSVALVALAIGLVVGVALPARPRHAPRMQVRSLGLLLIALGARALLTQAVPEGLAVLAAGAALVAVCACAYVNRAIIGLAVLGIGAAINLLGVVVNRGVPVDPDALVAIDAASPEEVATVDPGPARHLESSDDVLPWLGDVVPVVPLGTVVSFGDLIIAMGVADTAATIARRRRSRVGDLDAIDLDQRTATASAVHDWGRAPSGVASSGSQCSENPERAAPARSDAASARATTASPARSAASHSR
jgi:hypothetical protein